MNLSDLKPAWRQFRLLNSLEWMDQEEILYIIKRTQHLTGNSLQRMLFNAAMFIILMICCQGG